MALIDDILVDASPVSKNSLRSYFSEREHYVVQGDGLTDKSSEIASIYAAAPEGALIIFRGAVKITSPLTFNRRINILCPSQDDYILPALTTSQDAVTITGSTTVAGMDHKINIFGGASCCKNGLVVEKFFFGRIDAHVQVGAAEYGMKVLGALESQFRVRSSVNFTTPFGSPYVGVDHLYVAFDTGAAYAVNACTFDVFFAGGRHGIVIADQSQQGNSTYRGTIQGVTGRAIHATGCGDIDIGPFHLEGNDDAEALLDGCAGAHLTGIMSAASLPVRLTSCTDTVIDSYTGSLAIDATSKHTKITGLRLNDGDTFVNSSASTVMIGGGVTSTASATALGGGSGAPPVENIFRNPFMLIWTNGISAAPDDFSLGSGSIARNTTAPFGGNQQGISAAVTSTATAIGDMARGTVTGRYAVYQEDRWVSLMTAVYVASGQPDLIVTAFNGTSYVGGDIVTAKDTWTVVRFSIFVPAGYAPACIYAPWNGSAYVAGDFKVGGLSIVNGTVPPSCLIDSGRMGEYVVASVSNRPAFVGQRALVAGVFYMAKDITVSGDWVALN